ncbi:MAG TPA: hypothetical protein VFE18_10895, partial [Phenylobacterium sp.]|uniref:hypothetical protein n=1 Tax=Phenylobacterium sp. TaxID=1871053 RepID=UPI002D3F449B
MTISGDYPNPVTVNGYSCKNCTDVDYAKKNIDPAHPADGPFGVDAKDKPASTLARDDAGPKPDAPAVTFGGALANVSPASNASQQ